MKRLLYAAAIGAAIAPTLAFGDVDFMSRKYFQNVDGQRYWEVKVTCKGNATAKLMKRTVGGSDRWCSVNDPSLCNESTDHLSQLMCGATESDIAGKVKNSDSTTQQEAATPTASITKTTQAKPDKTELRNALMLEQVAIEEKRIKIEEKRLELAQRELALKKQLTN